MIKILELFGGIGSPRCALRNLDIPVKAIDYVEIDEKAVRSYNEMFKKELPYKIQDVRKWNLKPDILIHGSPCQDYSIAGQQKGADEGSGTRSSLMWETIHIIENMGKWKPKVVIWENVKNVLSKHMNHNFKKYLDYMKKLGYTNSYQILDARDFGLPQARERVFTISVLNGIKFDFSLLRKRQMIPIDNFLEDNSTIADHYIVTQPSILRKINGEDTGPLGNRVHIIGDSGKNFAYTICTKQMRTPNSGFVRLDDGRYRYLTERECWRLQGFSDEDFEAALRANPSRKGVMNGALYKQAGNSIPVTIFEAIFEVMLDSQIKNKEERNIVYKEEVEQLKLYS